MAQAERVIVETAFGRVQGEAAGGFVRFSGLPYGGSVVGDRRFALPGAAPRWTGVRDTIARASIPPQPPSRLAKVMGDFPAAQNEDCLHVDVWMPRERTQAAPVFVFLHGGAFITGGGSVSCYDGGLLAERAGSVVVNVTYRLGVLGLLPVQGVAPPNLFMHDQIAALRWVRQTIAAFGGDPACITIVGQSAGAYSIALLLAHPIGRELFDRAILMSTPLGLSLPSLDDAERLARELLAELGLAPDQAKALRDVPLPLLLQAQIALLCRPPQGAPGDVTPPFLPVIDGDLVPALPMQAVAAGAGAWCPTMIGVTREEMAAFYIDSPLENLSNEAVLREYQKAHGDGAADAFQKALAARSPSAPVAALMDLRGDEMFVTPSHEFARLQGAGGHRAFVYQFDWQAPQSPVAACHCIDLPFLFGNLEDWHGALMLAGSNPKETADLSRAMQNAFVAFARSGDPNAPALPVWPSHDHHGAVLHFDRKITAAGTA
ncbi:MAG: putative carboxylesterase [Hyphomicrobiales bacterium]|nr:putative carboxylesterase [Hyphomicrobiales bacterium]